MRPLLTKSLPSEVHVVERESVERGVAPSRRARVGGGERKSDDDVHLHLQF